MLPRRLGRSVADSTDGVGMPDHHTFRFDFKVPFLDPGRRSS